MNTCDYAVDKLNSLLKGELSAIETYQQALKKLGDEPDATPLREVHQEHIEAANLLRQHVHQHGGEPEHHSGAWGAFAQAVESSAKLLGNTAALKALKAGEERGVKDYESALQDSNMPADCQLLIRSDLLPRTRTHGSVLDRLMDVR